MTIASKNIADALARAAELGRQLRDLDADPGNHRLARDVWHAMNKELAAGADLEAARETMQRFPRLWGHCVTAARLAVEGGLHAPVAHPGVSDPERHPGPAWELLRAGLSDEAASGVINALVADRVDEIAHPTFFGKLRHPGELAEMKAPLLEELVQLDRRLAETVMLSAVLWQGSKPFLPVAVGMVAIEAESVGRLASATAELAAAGLRVAAAA